MRRRMMMQAAAEEEYNLVGSFAPGSTASDWKWKPNGEEQSLAQYVDPTTLQFKVKYEGMLTSCENVFSGGKLQTLEKFPDMSMVISAKYMFYSCKDLVSVDLSGVNSHKITDITLAFYQTTNLKKVDLTSLSSDALQKSCVTSVFKDSGIEELIIPDFGDLSQTVVYSMMFRNANSLRYIKCKRAFQKYCIGYSLDYTFINDNMKPGGTGVWDLID